jgi:hypothetical protein
VPRPSGTTELVRPSQSLFQSSAILYRLTHILSVFRVRNGFLHPENRSEAKNGNESEGDGSNDKGIAVETTLAVAMSADEIPASETMASPGTPSFSVYDVVS